MAGADGGLWQYVYQKHRPQETRRGKGANVDPELALNIIVFTEYSDYYLDM